MDADVRTSRVTREAAWWVTALGRATTRSPFSSPPRGPSCEPPIGVPGPSLRRRLHHGPRSSFFSSGFLVSCVPPSPPPSASSPCPDSRPSGFRPSSHQGQTAPPSDPGLETVRWALKEIPTLDTLFRAPSQGQRSCHRACAHLELPAIAPEGKLMGRLFLPPQPAGSS